MAKIKLGALAGQVSGSIGSHCFSRNRAGTYIRNRSIPTKVTNEYTTAVRSILTQCSQAWSGLLESERIAWEEWARLNPVMDRLGERIVLSGLAAHNRLNAIILGAGLTVISAPPTAQNPSPVLTLTPTVDIGSGDQEIAWTATPLAADHHLVLFGAVTQSTSQKYVENRWKRLLISAAAAVSPLDIETVLGDRFGTLAVGQFCQFKAAVLQGSTGLLSPYVRAATIVTDTP